MKAAEMNSRSSETWQDSIQIKIFNYLKSFTITLKLSPVTLSSKGCAEKAALLALGDILNVFIIHNKTKINPTNLIFLNIKLIFPLTSSSSHLNVEKILQLMGLLIGIAPTTHLHVEILD